MKPLFASKQLALLAFVLAQLPATPTLAKMRVVVAEDGTIQFVHMGEGAATEAHVGAVSPGAQAALAASTPASSAAALSSASAVAVAAPGISGSALADPGEAAAVGAEPGGDGFAEALPAPPPPVIIPPEKVEDPIAAQLNACEKISFDDTVLFDTAKHDLKDIAGPALDAVAKVLLAPLSTQVRIEGHTDSRGGMQYNQALSERRANAVYLALLQRGVPARQMEVVGYGITQPETTNDTATGRAMNRRVDLVPLNC